MRLFLFLFPIIFVISGCTLSGQEVKEIAVYSKFDDFEPLIQQDKANLYIINFWATWCKPCVKELPYFEEINEKYKEKGVEVILVSLDAENLLEKKLKPFIQERNLKSTVVVLDDTDFNSWIDKVSPKWTGAIPATLFYNKEKRQFMEQSFELDELNDIVETFLNQ
ncbi:MAG: TlpA family protein disulfide reductase [Bacteroidota bacterium]